MGTCDLLFWRFLVRFIFTVSYQLVSVMDFLEHLRRRKDANILASKFLLSLCLHELIEVFSLITKTTSTINWY